MTRLLIVVAAALSLSVALKLAFGAPERSGTGVVRLESAFDALLEAEGLPVLAVESLTSDGRYRMRVLDPALCQGPLKVVVSHQRGEQVGLVRAEAQEHERISFVHDGRLYDDPPILTTYGRDGAVRLHRIFAGGRKPAYFAFLAFVAPEDCDIAALADWGRLWRPDVRDADPEMKSGTPGLDVPTFGSSD